MDQWRIFISGAGCINIGSPKSGKVSGGNTTISVIKPSSISKNVQRQGTPGVIAGPAHVSCDRRLQVGVGHNTVEATKLFGAESAFDP